MLKIVFGIMLICVGALYARGWWRLYRTGHPPTQWRLEHGHIMLMSERGETWRFEADDNAQCRLVPDSAEPLIMLRQ